MPCWTKRANGTRSTGIEKIQIISRGECKTLNAITNEWWKSAVIYQIYSRSFLDTNNDGFGDLDGIISKLDYLADLGIDAIWLTPIYPSPDADYGYDTTDHCAIDPRYGTMEDFDQLVNEAHERGITVMMDIVLAYTSDRHPWLWNRANPAIIHIMITTCGGTRCPAAKCPITGFQFSEAKPGNMCPSSASITSTSSISLSLIPTGDIPRCAKPRWTFSNSRSNGRGRIPSGRIQPVLQGRTIPHDPPVSKGTVCLAYRAFAHSNNSTISMNAINRRCCRW